VEEGLRDIPTRTHTMASFKMGKLMVKGFIPGQMEKYMTVNGKMA